MPSLPRPLIMMMIVSQASVLACEKPQQCTDWRCLAVQNPRSLNAGEFSRLERDDGKPVESLSQAEAKEFVLGYSIEVPTPPPCRHCTELLSVTCVVFGFRQIRQHAARDKTWDGPSEWRGKLKLCRALKLKAASTHGHVAVDMKIPPMGDDRLEGMGDIKSAPLCLSRDLLGGIPLYLVVLSR